MEDITMSEPWLEKSYDMNDYRKDMDTVEEIYLDKDIKHDISKLIDKVDDLEQKIINLNTKFHWLVKDFKELKDKDSKHEI